MHRDAIVARGLTYRYSKRLAVDHISFTVAHGEILGFLGPNGAGKTTTVKMLTGQLRPASGKAILLGMDIVTHTKDIQSKIGVCSETTNLYEQMTAAENLRLFAQLFGMGRFNPNPLLRAVGLAGRASQRVDTFSKGMKQRLMLARALVNRPRILFLDEPTEGLDPASAETIRNLILRLRSRGTTIFLTTHDMVEADKLSDRVAFINHGKLVALDKPHNLKQQYGKRALKVEVSNNSGDLEEREVVLDAPETASAVQELFARENVVTVHSEEATLEDIFIKITGRRLQE